MERGLLTIPETNDEETIINAPIQDLMGDDVMSDLIERRRHALRQVMDEDRDRHLKQHLTDFARDAQAEVAIAINAYRHDLTNNPAVPREYIARYDIAANKLENRMEKLVERADEYQIYDSAGNFFLNEWPLLIHNPQAVMATFGARRFAAAHRELDESRDYEEMPKRAHLGNRPGQLQRFMKSEDYKPYLLRKGAKGPQTEKKTKAKAIQMTGPQEKIWEFLGYGQNPSTMKGGTKTLREALLTSIIDAEESTRRPKVERLWVLHQEGGPFANLRSRANHITRQALADARQAGDYMGMATIMRRLMRQPDVIPQQAVGIGMLGAVGLLPFGLDEKIDDAVAGRFGAHLPQTAATKEARYIEHAVDPAMAGVRALLGLGHTEELLHGAGLGHLVGAGPYKDKMEASIRSFLRINKGRIEDKYRVDSGDPEIELFRVPQVGALFQQFIRDSVAEGRAKIAKKFTTGAKFNPLKIFGRRAREQGFLGRQIFGAETADAKEKLIDATVDDVGERLVVMLGNFVKGHTEAQLREMGINREALFDTVEFFTNVAAEEIDNPEAGTYNPHRYAPFTTEGSRETVASPVVSGLNPMFRRRVKVVPARRAAVPEEEEEEEEESSSDEERGEADYEGDDEGRFAGEGRVRKLLHGAGLGHLVRTPRRKHLGKGI